jgi:predicted transcriptional regulator
MTSCCRRCSGACLTKLLDRAIARTKALSEAERDAAAQVLLAAFDADGAAVALDEATMAALEEGLARARRGEFADDAEVAALLQPAAAALPRKSGE